MVEYLNRELPDGKELPEGACFWEYLDSFDTSERERITNVLTTR